MCKLRLTVKRQVQIRQKSFLIGRQKVILIKFSKTAFQNPSMLVTDLFFEAEFLFVSTPLPDDLDKISGTVTHGYRNESSLPLS